jgi:hypothetical protein
MGDIEMQTAKDIASSGPSFCLAKLIVLILI